MKNKAITTTIMFLAGIFILVLDVVPVAATSDDSIVGLWHFDKRFGTALEFDGLNDYILVDDDPSLGGMTELTVEAWIKWGGSTGKAQYIVSKYLETGNQRGFILGLHSDNTLRMWVSSNGFTASGNFDYLTSSYTPPVGSWIHVAGVFRGGSFIKLFVNGVEVAFKSTTVPSIFDNTDVLYIGRYFTDRYHKGVIDEVRISDVAKTSFDLTGPLAADIDTVALWHFDDTPNTTAVDSSVNDNDGTLYNFGSGWVDTSLTPDTSTNNNFGTINGAAWTTSGAYDGALSFDGDDYVEVSHSTSMDVSLSYTFEAWVYLTDDSDYRGLFRRGTRGELPSEIEIYIHPGSHARKLVVAHNRGGASWGYRYFTTFPLHQWVYLAVTWDGTTVRAYYNAIEQTSISGLTMFNPAVSDKPSFIGLGYFAAYTLGNTPYMIGDIDEVRIWDQALAAEEVYTCYKNKGKVLPIAGPIIWTSAFKVPQDEESSVTIYIWPSDLSVEIDHVELSRKMPFTPKNTGGCSFETQETLPHSITITNIPGTCKTMHLWLYLSTGEHVGVNVQFR